MFYHYTGPFTLDQVQAKLGEHEIDGDALEASNGDTYVQTDEDETVLAFVFGTDLKALPAPKRTRGKNVGAVEIAMMLMADGTTAAEVAEETGFAVSTVKKYLPMRSVAETWIMGFLMHKLADAGAIPDATPAALWDFLPDDGEIGAIIGLRYWRKAKPVVDKMRGKLIEIASLEREIGDLKRHNDGLEMITGSMKRFNQSGGRLN